MEGKKKHAHHGFTHSHIEHHADGSHTVEHHHNEGPHKNVRHAAMSLDHVHDSLQDHLGLPNPGEAEANAGQHGVAAEPAAAAGLPAQMPAVAPGMPGAGA